jgi:hypothetical protein
MRAAIKGIPSPIPGLRRLGGGPQPSSRTITSIACRVAPSSSSKVPLRVVTTVGVQDNVRNCLADDFSPRLETALRLGSTEQTDASSSEEQPEAQVSSQAG